MAESSGCEPGVSALDRAHGLRIAGEIEPALRLATGILEASAADLGAAYLLSKLLWELKRPSRVAATAKVLIDRFTRRGDLGGACVSALLAIEAGADKKSSFAAIARAFGAGSTRVGDAPALPPPLPNEVKPVGSSGDALLTAAESALSRFAALPDTVPDTATLPRLPLFGALAPPVLAKLLGALTLREYAAGHAVMRQGDDGSEAYLLVRGVLNVVREEGSASTLLAVLGPGAFFGEMALMSRGPRGASVFSVEPAQVLAVTRAQLEQLARTDPTIGRELGRFCQKRMLANLVGHSRILSAVEPEKRRELVARFAAQTFAPGDMLVKQDEEGGSLFLIASGLVEVRSTDVEGDKVVLAQLGPGEVVGEISLVLRRPAMADVVAVHSTVALELTWSEFHEAIREYPGLLQQLYDIATQREAETRNVATQEALDVSDIVLL
ncbi:MAG: hypothetical protein RL701_3608 [Pseudomonadota bacterium]